MRVASVAPLLVSSLLLAGCLAEAERPSADDTAAPAAGSDAALIANALSAGTPELSASATVLLPGREMRTLRPGTNGWTCIPDNPAAPGNMPMCMDAATMDWAMAFMSGAGAPPRGRPVGISYMLQGTWFPSVSDPTVEPGPGVTGVHTGPMLMLVNTPPEILAGYPRTADDPSRPFVMFAGTPWEHLMIPVR